MCLVWHNSCTTTLRIKCNGINIKYNEKFSDPLDEQLPHLVWAELILTLLYLNPFASAISFTIRGSLFFASYLNIAIVAFFTTAIVSGDSNSVLYGISKTRSSFSDDADESDGFALGMVPAFFNLGVVVLVREIRNMAKWVSRVKLASTLVSSRRIS